MQSQSENMFESAPQIVYNEVYFCRDYVVVNKNALVLRCPTPAAKRTYAPCHVATFESIMREALWVQLNAVVV